MDTTSSLPSFISHSFFLFSFVSAFRFSIREHFYFFSFGLFFRGRKSRLKRKWEATSKSNRPPSDFGEIYCVILHALGMAQLNRGIKVRRQTLHLPFESIIFIFCFVFACATIENFHALFYCFFSQQIHQNSNKSFSLAAVVLDLCILNRTWRDFELCSIGFYGDFHFDKFPSKFRCNFRLLQTARMALSISTFLSIVLCRIIILFSLRNTIKFTF